MNKNTINIIAIVLLVIFITDFIISFFIISRLRKTAKEVNEKNSGDNTEEITKKVKELLEASGAMVILTRNDDTSLYTEQVGKTIRQKYNENLKNRKKIIQESSADMFISIHLNKFQESKYYGAQTFYPAGKEDDKQLATYIQGELKRVVDKTNNRKIKSTNDIFLIKDNMRGDNDE